MEATKLAVTVLAAVMLVVQVVLVPVQPPLQLENLKPVPGAAVSVTWVPLA